MRQGSDKELIDLISEIDQKEKQRKMNNPTEADEEDDKGRKAFTIKPEKNDGYITVKNNEIFIKDGEGNGQQPSLIPNDNLTTFVNGKQIDSETIVSEGDEIRIKELSNSSPYHIRISEDKLKVTFQLKKKLILKEAAPTVKLKVDVIEITPSLEIQSELLKVREDLIQLGIQLEINLSAIMTELLQPTFEEIIIVEGRPPVQGKDGFVEYYFKIKKEEVYEEVGGKINFKNRFKIPTVEAGNIIGKVHEAIDGKEGVNVFGESIHPKKPKRVNIRAKENVNILSDGQIVALASGRPSITGRVLLYISILKAHIVYGDVDIKTGNIFFKGDVIIKGNVNDGMRVEAEGNIYIEAGVYNSTIASYQNVYINGPIINSHVYGGYYGLIYSFFYSSLQAIYSVFTNLKKAIHQVVQHAGKQSVEYKYGHIISILMDKKFKHFYHETNRFEDFISDMRKNDMPIPENVLKVENLLNKFSQKNLALLVTSEKTLNNIIKFLEAVFDESEQMVHEDSDIGFSTSNASIIKTNGSINIINIGVINTDLYSDRDIHFNKENAVLRGGKIEARGSIRAGEIGTETGKPPYLIAGDKIFVHYLRNARVQILSRTRDFFEQLKNVTIYYDEKSDGLKFVHR